ncbi:MULTISPECIES: hypothetical protein [Xanthomonas]|uniref:hypothetical protein n=1 Tax=Xanthomonas TaxID=338 RepID=UPI0021B4799A|nr:MULTISPECIES: hypothetical protein [Xanthomonas]MEA9761798.1 hypothetical protein [Xanthomonas campestris pv. raphani]MEA9814007.1 hypothetical protein [Xanthomonas campestris pv. raphani]MEA9907098.1 hypothetical protein [Xanthomonas campestris pv. raphani]MEA9923395.1 hypothetical protein [Xanthomonas campestris pv. raphani]MEA9935796.1 hypothetical protein [Xanthomonas campestris pv. raphani]
MENLRQQLVEVSLAWEAAFGNAPAITSALSEYDAAALLGCSLADYSACMRDATAIQRGHDFVYQGLRYQVKGNRPSGKRGSTVTRVPKPSNYEWDRLIWVLYNPRYEMQEAWLWEVEDYRQRFDAISRLGPGHMRMGHSLIDDRPLQAGRL